MLDRAACQKEYLSLGDTVADGGNKQQWQKEKKPFLKQLCMEESSFGKFSRTLYKFEVVLSEHL